jgi:hypothetical protein
MKYLPTLIFVTGLLALSNCNEDDLKSPAKPELVSPTDGTTDAELNLTFNWNTTKDAKSYGFQLSVTSDFTSTENNSSGIEELSISVDNLMPDTKYYWRVNAKNSAGISEWSDVWEVTTEPVGIPTLTAPEDNSIINPNQTTLEWNSINDADGYTLQVSLSEDFSSTIVNKESLTETSFNISDLEWFSTYYWRVKASIDLCNSEWSEVWSFTPELPIPSNGLVAYYPFNGNANDESGNSFNGTATGSILTSDRNGVANKAYLFDGVDDIIELPNIDPISSGTVGEYTLAVWVNLSALNTAATGDQCWVFGDEISQNNGIAAQIHTTYGYGAYTAGANLEGYSNYIPTVGQWVLYCQVQNSDGIDLYINGQFFKHLTDSKNSETSQATRIGLFTGCSGSCQRPLNGKVDDIRVYNRALSVLEVQALYYE